MSKTRKQLRRERKRIVDAIERIDRRISELRHGVRYTTLPVGGILRDSLRRGLEILKTHQLIIPELVGVEPVWHRYKHKSKGKTKH